jgi:hypothetical protein
MTCASASAQGVYLGGEALGWNRSWKATVIFYELEVCYEKNLDGNPAGELAITAVVRGEPPAFVSCMSLSKMYVLPGRYDVVFLLAASG